MGDKWRHPVVCGGALRINRIDDAETRGHLPEEGIGVGEGHTLRPCNDEELTPP